MFHTVELQSEYNKNKHFLFFCSLLRGIITIMISNIFLTLELRIVYNKIIHILFIFCSLFILLFTLHFSVHTSIICSLLLLLLTHLSSVHSSFQCSLLIILCLWVQTQTEYKWLQASQNAEKCRFSIDRSHVFF